MPPILTTNAIIQCNHGGFVKLAPRQTQVSIQGGFVMCEGDLTGAPVIGCKLKPTAVTSPCLTVVETLPGSSAPTVQVGGRPVYLQTMVAVTNSRPPGSTIVVFPGQVAVQAA